jgi:hypothetical protein
MGFRALRTLPQTVRASRRYRALAARRQTVQIRTGEDLGLWGRGTEMSGIGGSGPPVRSPGQSAGAVPVT